MRTCPKCGNKYHEIQFKYRYGNTWRETKHCNPCRGRALADVPDEVMPIRTFEEPATENGLQPLNGGVWKVAVYEPQVPEIKPLVMSRAYAEHDLRFPDWGVDLNKG